MNDAYAYRLTPSASRDIVDISDYIAIDLCARDSAVKLINAMEDAIRHACRFPHAAPIVNDALLAQRGYRKLVVENYIILYLCDDENRIVNIMRVVYSSRDCLRDI